MNIIPTILHTHRCKIALLLFLVAFLIILASFWPLIILFGMNIFLLLAILTILGTYMFVLAILSVVILFVCGLFLFVVTFCTLFCLLGISCIFLAVCVVFVANLAFFFSILMGIGLSVYFVLKYMMKLVTYLYEKELNSSEFYAICPMNRKINSA